MRISDRSVPDRRDHQQLLPARGVCLVVLGVRDPLFHWGAKETLFAAVLEPLFRGIALLPAIRPEHDHVSTLTTYQLHSVVSGLP